MLKMDELHLDKNNKTDQTIISKTVISDPDIGEIEIKKKILFKTVVYRLISFVFILVLTCIYFGDVRTSTNYTFVNVIGSTICYYIFEVYWNKYYK